jgi:hypothetical protein
MAGLLPNGHPKQAFKPEKSSSTSGGPARQTINEVAKGGTPFKVPNLDRALRK